MADVSDHQMVPNGVSDQETRWKGKYFTLLKHCRQMEQVTNQLITYICLTYNQLTAAVAHGSICVIVLWQRLSKSSKRFFFSTDRCSFHNITWLMERFQNQKLNLQLHRFKSEAYLFSFYLIKHVGTVSAIWITCWCQISCHDDVTRLSETLSPHPLMTVSTEVSSYKKILLETSTPKWQERETINSSYL